MLRRLRWLLACVPLLLAGVTDALELQPVLSGLSSPLFLTHAGDGSGRLFVVEQGGVIKVLQPGASVPTVFLDITPVVLSGGEQGLLGLAFHPRYAANGRFFVYYTRRQPINDGAIVIAEYGRSSFDVASPVGSVLLTIPHPSFTNHNGGMLAFGPDGFLYAGVGDGGSGNDPANNAQNIASLLGKILRINVDATSPGLPYAIPDDNPFAGAVSGADEIFAFGLRNPFRFSFDRATGQLIVGDVGQASFEEIDIVTRGANMGWRVFEGFHCNPSGDPGLCGNGGFTFPIAEYAHTGGRCSVTGGYVYRGQAGALPPGTYVFGDFCSGEIFTLAGTGAAVLLDTTLSISSFGEDQAGELYVVNLNGTVHRLIGGTTEAQQRFIAGFYANVLGRAPGPGELEAWADFLRSNCNPGGVQTIARGFFGSAEFAARPLSLADHVTVLYRALLGRDPDPAGLAAWTDVLRQGRLGLAVSGFIPSQEFRTRLPDRTNRTAVETLITQFYSKILDRAPDAAGAAAWTDFVVRTGALETAAVGFLTSPEFEMRALTLQDYVTILYRAFLGREPDAAGLAAWQRVLSTTLANVVESGFLPAAEFNLAALCGG